MTLAPEIPSPTNAQPLSPAQEGRDPGATQWVDWKPLVDYRRNGVAETTIHGAISWVSGKELIYGFGGNVMCYGRSMMKPLMMKVFAEEFQDTLTWEEKAISVASHNADTEHIRVVKGMLSEAEMGLMQTPFDVPLMQFGRQVRRPRRWYHCCSGEHAAIIRGCKMKGWSRVGYVWPHHPFTQSYLRVLKRYLGEDWTPYRIAKDGCGLPTISNTVTELATCFAALVTEKDRDWIWEAMVRHPDLVGGFNRLDSTILKACGGRVIAKEGADGLLGMAIEHPDFPHGLGVVIKIAHGWNPQATWYVARMVLAVLGFDLRNPYKLHRQKAFIVQEVIPPDLRKNLAGYELWDPWDPDIDKWEFDPAEFCQPEGAWDRYGMHPEGETLRG
ncbi:MAG TPA: asparaginase [bacterium]|nr:asparaginase [bacterium]